VVVESHAPGDCDGESSEGKEVLDAADKPNRLHARDAQDWAIQPDSSSLSFVEPT